MELASMIAHEPFSDHPYSVCPVIGTFLRAYNDTIDDERRQDLYRYAAQVVDTRGSREIREQRGERLLTFADELHAGRNFFFRVIRRFFVGATKPSEKGSVGTIAARAISRHTDDTHARVLALLDELCAIRSQRKLPEPARSPGQHCRAAGQSDRAGAGP